MSAIDQAFVKAITTIKTVSRGPNTLAKPPLERKAQLYGLYKQATEGDVKGIMPRPVGDDAQSGANQRKWDAWKQQEGLSKREAKLKYVGYLLDTMRELRLAAADTPLPANWAELEQSFEAAKRADPAEAPGHRRRLSVGSVNSSYSQFLRTPAPPIVRQAAYSEFGLSERDRSELQADQFVERIQSAFPHVVPGAIELGGAVPNPALSSLSYRAETATGGGGPSEPGSERPPSVLGSLAAAGERVGAWIRAVCQRVAVDSAWVVALLVLVRFVAARPQLLRRLPVSSRMVSTMGKVIAVVLNEVGIEVRLRPADSTAKG